MNLCMDCGVVLRGHGDPVRCRHCASVANRAAPEVRAKIGEASRRQWADPVIRAKHVEASKALHALGVYDNLPILQPSSLEVALAGAMDAAGIVYEQQFRPYNSRRFYDFVVPDQNLLIEVDGEYWHSLDKAKPVDREKDLEAVRLGYDILRVREEDIHAYGPDYVVQNWIKGIEPRHYSEAMAERWTKPFVERMQEAADRGARKARRLK